MLKLFCMNLCGFMHIRLCSLFMGTYGFKLYILFYLFSISKQNLHVGLRMYAIFLPKKETDK